jgi:hypothetical protein
MKKSIDSYDLDRVKALQLYERKNPSNLEDLIQSLDDKEAQAILCDLMDSGYTTKNKMIECLYFYDSEMFEHFFEILTEEDDEYY